MSLKTYEDDCWSIMEDEAIQAHPKEEAHRLAELFARQERIAANHLLQFNT